MARKKLVVVYYSTLSNEEIVDADFDDFYNSEEGLKGHKATFKTEDIYIQSIYPPSAEKLVTQINEILAEPYDEIYFHFNGHGKENGIPYGKFLLEKDDFANFLNDPKVKFCFFSSCNSDDLSKIVHDKKIPIVIGIDGKIENTHAIEIQKKFYGYLAKKFSFKAAFKKAISEEKIQGVSLEKRKDYELGDKVIHRGGGSWVDLNNKIKYSLNILGEAVDINKHLIYPNVVEEIRNAKDQKQVILVYSHDEKTLINFNTYYEQAQWGEFNNELFILSQDDFIALIKEEENLYENNVTLGKGGMEYDEVEESLNSEMDNNVFEKK